MKMNCTVYALALAASAYAAPAAAQDAAAPEAPASAFTLNGGAALVSDYRFRGISQTDRRFALQGNITVKHASGFYGTIWGSSVDDYIANGSDQEIDFVAGFAKTIGGATLDAGVTYYYYPGSGGIATDFYEPYAAVSHSFGPVSGKLFVAYAPKQNGLSLGAGREDNLYVAADISGAIPGMPVTVTGHLGRNFQRSYITFGEKYTDWSVAANYAWRNLNFGLAYVDTNNRLYSPTPRNITKGGIVASVGVAF